MLASTNASNSTKMPPRGPLSKGVKHLEWALAGLIVAAPLAMGANPLLLRVAAAFVSVVLLGWGLWATRGRPQSTQPALVGAVLLLMLLWTILQVVPVPCSLLEAIGHRPGLQATESLRAFGIHDGRCHLTADPGRTMVALLSQVAVTSTFFCAAIVCRLRGPERCTWALIVATLSMAAVTLLHAVVGATRVYGVYTPSSSVLAVAAPIINANHLGGFLLLGVGLVLARAFIAREPTRRAGWYLALLFLGGAIVQSRSRGALAAAFATLSVFFVLRLGDRREEMSVLKVGGVLLLALLGLGSVFAGSSLESLLELAKEGGVSKLEVIWSLLAFSIHAPWLGVGRGALGPAFTAAGIDPARIEHAESELVQLAVEWGWPAACLCVVSVLLVLIRARDEARKSRRASGAVASLVGFGAHSLLESQLEIPGVAMCFVVLLAICSTARKVGGRRSDENSLWRKWSGALGRGGPAVALVASTGALVTASYSALTNASHESAVAATNGEGSRCEAHHERLNRLARAHPADPLVAIMGAEHYLKDGHSAAPLWINRALDLAPKWAAPHVLAAHWLMQLGRLQQGAEEFREAVTLDPSTPLDLVCWLAGQPNGAELVVLAAPEGATGNRVLDGAVSCVGLDTRAQANFDRRVLERRPEAVGARARQIGRSLAAGDVVQARRIFEDAPQSTGLTFVHARLLEAEGRRPEAIRVLSDTREGPLQWWLQRELVLMYARANEQGAVQEALEALRTLAGGTPQRLAETYLLQAQVLRLRGNELGALSALERGQRLFPSPDVLRQIGEVAERLKLSSRAYQVYDELCRTGVRDACNSRERVRLAAQ